MRVTIDRDVSTYNDVLRTLRLGRKYIGRQPDEIKKSSGGRGYHYIWYNAAKSFRESLKLRKLIGDDPNRIKKDKLKRGGFRQILFTKKNARGV